MNSSNPSHTPGTHPEWQMLGELTLSNGPAADEPIHSWLTGLLQPLSLHPDFLDRIARSAQDAAVRTFQSPAAVQYDHIHLVIHGPREQTSKQGIWGFFRVEKVEGSTDEISAAHSIEFYLYMEGQA